MNKKGTMTVSIVLLVVFTLLLVSSALYMFITKNNSSYAKIYTPSALEDIYSKETQLNFYLMHFTENSAKGINEDDSNNIKEIFLANFQKELDKYKTEGKFLIPEFSFVEPQLKEENVIIKDNAIKIKFKIKIEDSLKDKEKEILSAVYIYEKEFQAQISQPLIQSSQTAP